MQMMLAHYIDPGTGSMLFTLFIGIVTTAYFFVRQLIIKLKFSAGGGRAKDLKGQGKLPYVIFAESKRYWNVFKPICDEFERRGVDVAYWTTSSDDPSLSEPYQHVHAEFIGEENKAFARLNMLSARVCLATTPGLDVYQWKRSPEVDWYVHTLHAVGSAAGYRMFGIDYYDAMLLSGSFQVDEVRELERKRKLPAKQCELVGCTYLDALAERLAREGTVTKDTTTVLLAPSWGSAAILSVYGERIIEALVATGFEVIIRPHPQSMVSEREMIDALMARFPEGERLSWNFDNDNFDALNRADVMISDFSGVVFDYALVFDKPIIYTESRFDADPYDASWLDEPLWKFSVYPTLGIPLAEGQFPRMREVIEQAIADEGLRAGRERAREQVWVHRGDSARLTVDYLVQAHEALERGERPYVDATTPAECGAVADAAQEQAQPEAGDALPSTKAAADQRLDAKTMPEQSRIASREAAAGQPDTADRGDAQTPDADAASGTTHDSDGASDTTEPTFFVRDPLPVLAPERKETVAIERVAPEKRTGGWRSRRAEKRRSRVKRSADDRYIIIGERPSEDATATIVCEEVRVMSQRDIDELLAEMDSLRDEVSYLRQDLEEMHDGGNEQDDRRAR